MKANLFKYTTWIKKYKIAITAAVFIIILLVLYLYLNTKTSTTPISNATPLNLIATIPNEGVTRSVWEVEKIKFVFDDYIDDKTIKYSITPNIKSRTISTETPVKHFEILPISGWKEGVEYIITISKDLESLKGNKLKEDIVFKIKRISPKPGDPDFPLVDFVEPGR